MNITPIGPFCPFRSEACRLDGNVDTGMGSLTSKSTSFMADMARLQLESQMGTEPDPERVKSMPPAWALEHIRADQATFRAEVERAGFRLVASPVLDELRENYIMVFEKT